MIYLIKILGINIIPYEHATLEEVRKILMARQERIFSTPMGRIDFLPCKLNYTTVYSTLIAELEISKELVIKTLYHFRSSKSKNSWHTIFKKEQTLCLMCKNAV